MPVAANSFPFFHLALSSLAYPWPGYRTISRCYTGGWVERRTLERTPFLRRISLAAQPGLGAPSFFSSAWAARSRATFASATLEP